MLHQGLQAVPTITDEPARSSIVPVAFSVGFANYDPVVSRAKNIEKLMSEAQAMYAEKQLRRGSRTFQEKKWVICPHSARPGARRS